MAAFDNAARVVHRTLGITSSVKEASWRRTGWLKNVANKAPALASLVDLGSDGHHVLTILAAFRNTIHGELASLLTFQQASLPTDTRVGLPYEEATDVLKAMDALSGRAAWGVDQARPSSPSDTYVRPGLFIEQLLPRATRLLDALLTATPVETLSGVCLSASDRARPTDPSDLSSVDSAQRIRWQLGLWPLRAILPDGSPPCRGDGGWFR